MSSQVARPWLAATAKYSRWSQRSVVSVGGIRHYLKATGEEQPPETQADWLRMQLDRKDFKTLGMSQRSNVEPFRSS